MLLSVLAVSIVASFAGLPCRARGGLHRTEIARLCCCAQLADLQLDLFTPAVNYACLVQISSLPRLSPLTEPGPKPAQGSLLMVSIAALSAASAPSNGTRPFAMAPMGRMRPHQGKVRLAVFHRFFGFLALGHDRQRHRGRNSDQIEWAEHVQRQRKSLLKCQQKVPKTPCFIVEIDSIDRVHSTATDCS